MIEVEGKLDNHPITIFIDFGASHNYIDLNMIDKFKLNKCENENSWLVHLATRTKRSINGLVMDCLVNMNGVITKVF
jgi:hypothetical protein